MVLSEPLLQIGSFSVYSFGLFLAFIFILGAFIFWRAATRSGFASDTVFDLTFLSSLVALLVGRVFFLLSAGSPSITEPIAFAAAILRVGEGIFWAPAFLAGLCVFYIFTRRRKEWSFFKLADLAVPVLALSEGLVLLAALATAHLASALYVSIGYLVLFFFLEFLRRKVATSGVVFWVYLLFSGALTLLLEFQRELKTLAFGTDLNYLLGIALWIAGGSGLIYFLARSRGVLDAIHQRISVSPLFGKVEKQLQFRLKEGRRLMRSLRLRRAKNNDSEKDLSTS
jgi:prolipoprotein diacylglyceryltransferase